MKTLTVTISDEAAEGLAQTAAGARRSEEDVAAQALEETFAPDWFDDLDAEAQAAIAGGVAEADREEFASEAEVDAAFARFKR